MELSEWRRTLRLSRRYQQLSPLTRRFSLSHLPASRVAQQRSFCSMEWVAICSLNKPSIRCQISTNMLNACLLPSPMLIPLQCIHPVQCLLRLQSLHPIRFRIYIPNNSLLVNQHCSRNYHLSRVIAMTFLQISSYAIH